MARTMDGGSIVIISFCGGTVGGKSAVKDLWLETNQLDGVV